MPRWDDILNRILPPVDNNSARVFSDYGVPRTEGTNPHVGIDFNYIGGQTGINLTHPQLHAPVSGRIVDPLGGYWGTISILDANGYTHQILHTHDRHVQVGQPVNARDPIGTMGDTGAKGRQHVHYQIRDRRSQVVNPREYWSGMLDVNPPEAAAESIPLPRPRPTIPEASAVPSGESSSAPANTVDDSNWLASVLNPKPFTPDVSRLDTWPQPPYPPDRFYPQSPNGIVDYRFYDGASVSPSRDRASSPAPQSSTPSIDQPAPDSPFNPYRLQPFPPQLLPPSTSGSVKRTSMPGDPNAETPLARLLRLTAGETTPGDDADPSADSTTTDIAPVRFADPLAILTTLVRLSAMRDGSG